MSSLSLGGEPNAGSTTQTISPWALGANMYTPATHTGLLEAATSRFPTLPAISFCTEDAVREEDVVAALHNLETVLPQLVGQRGPHRFVRVRSPEVLRELLNFDLRALGGLVLPKIHAGNLGRYMDILHASHWPTLLVMPTLETREVFDPAQMRALRDLLLTERWAEQVAVLRIGGNDLMNTLGVRRRPSCTLYEGPLAGVIADLVSTFLPYGLALSSPVYEVIDDPTTLAREVQSDIDYGLSGKTIVHPAQLATVLHGLRVSHADLAEAQAILQPDAPAVFQLSGRMCEPATHGRWAQGILWRAELYGTVGGN